MATAVVCAAFDAAADAALQRLRVAVEATGHRVRRAHRPHLTLAAARLPDPAPVIEVARVVARSNEPFPLDLVELGTFSSGVLFVRPATSDALRELQRDAHDALVAAGWPPAFGPRSEPPGWQPHCTLATRLPRRDLGRLRHLPFERIHARVEALAVIMVGGRGDVAHLPLGDAARS